MLILPAAAAIVKPAPWDGWNLPLGVAPYRSSATLAAPSGPGLDGPILPGPGDDEIARMAEESAAMDRLESGCFAF